MGLRTRTRFWIDKLENTPRREKLVTSRMLSIPQVGVLESSSFGINDLYRVGVYRCRRFRHKFNLCPHRRNGPGTGVRLIAYFVDASNSSGFNSIQLNVTGLPSTYATGQDIDARLSLYYCGSDALRRCLTFKLAQNTLFSQVDVTDYLPTEMMISFSGRSTYVDAEISRIAVTRLC